MLKRVHIDNYRTLVGFELVLEREVLFIGRNGSGKTTVFDAIDAVTRFARGESSIETLFPAASICRWDKRSIQTFELDFVAHPGEAEFLLQYDVTFRYRLVIEHDGRHPPRVLEESVHVEQQPLFVCREGQAQLYKDDGLGPGVLVDWTRSSLPALRRLPENQRLTWFTDRLARVNVASPQPHNMVPLSEREEPLLARDFSNVASWYRHIQAEESERVDVIRERLREILDGFVTIDLKKDSGTARRLWTKWKSTTAQPLEFTLDELSDGQRVLIGLAILASLPHGPGATLLLDEPDNYVALSEIQPLLMSLRGREALQLVVISHHPEVINLQARDHGLVFWRDNNGPTRVRPFASDSELPPAEVVARGEE